MNKLFHHIPMDNINELNSLNYAIENMDSPRGTHIESEKQKFNEK